MGSVEYLRVRINQQLQMLRHVYRDTNAEKAAIKVAKQRVINERMATQNERSKLLMAIDHNKYFWPPDSQPVSSHVVLFFKKYSFYHRFLLQGELLVQIQQSQHNISRLRAQIKEQGIQIN